MNIPKISAVILLIMGSFVVLTLILTPKILRIFGNSILPEQDLQEYRVLDNLSGDKKLIVWQDGGGATSAHLTLASLVDSAQDVGAYINEPYAYSNVFSAYRSEDICFEQLSDNTIKIIYNGGEVRKQKSIYKGVNFVYEIGDCPDW
ncbi:MAG: hypothetical protein WC730_02995 [Patescibacteria group bacterium]